MSHGTMTPHELRWVHSTDVVSPLRYDLYIEPWIEYSSILSRADIHIQIQQPTNIIKLHGLRITVYQVFFNGTITHECSSHHVDNHYETLEFEFEQPLPVGTGILTIIYSSSIDTTGIFTRRREGTHSLHTQCEPCNARQVLPCWDQPTAKAIFRLVVYIDEDYDCISNTPAERVSQAEPNNNIQCLEDKKKIGTHTIPIYRSRGRRKRIEFEPTCLMSTYMLAFTVDKLNHMTSSASVPVYENGVEIPGQTQTIPISVYAPPSRISEAQFVLKMTLFAWDYFTRQFRLNNPLKKLDIVSVDQLPVLGSENWGIICLHSMYMLIDASTPFSKIQRIARLVCHEVVHQWFGNLVTMPWWKDLWLKEGFARYLEYVAIEHLFPSWRYWSYFMRDIFKLTMEYDESANTHPVESEVGDPKEISEIFDLMSYGKGACVLRMVSNYIGMGAFWSAIRIFLRKFSYSCAGTEDLYQALSEASSVDVSSIMNCWMKFSGHPVLVVDLSENSTEFQLNIRQELCFRDRLNATVVKTSRMTNKSELNREHTNTDYNLPIRLAHCACRQVTPKNLLMNQFDTSLQWKGILSDDHHITINTGHTGFFRTCYDHNLLRRLLRAGQQDRLSLQELQGVLADMWTLIGQRTAAESNHSNHVTRYPTIDVLLRFLDEISADLPWNNQVPRCHPVIWEMSTKRLCDLMLQIHPDHLPSFRIYLQRLYTSALRGVGLWKEQRRPNASADLTEYNVDPDNETLWAELRSRIIIFLSAARALPESVVDEVMPLFENVTESLSIGDSMLGLSDHAAGAILHTGVAHGGRDAYDTVSYLFRTHRQDNVKKLCFQALFQARDYESMEMNLQMVVKAQSNPMHSHPEWMEDLLTSHVISLNSRQRNMMWRAGVELLRRGVNTALFAVWLSTESATLREEEKAEFVREAEQVVDTSTLLGASLHIARSAQESARNNGSWYSHNRQYLLRFFV
ncbi:puromycin-sensitive aminopeptidase-like [Planoprotostelium fungivorum]|uniref:Aminopeptidase n=1 Tax=Planoprotostelium fungivorum TaxID=1890364 RepID=A0A2P6MPF7_9EUKA|nr:puromycin-sensitive aminopeptidase-like [Planoprotostelium fungivorum]